MYYLLNSDPKKPLVRTAFQQALSRENWIQALNLSTNISILEENNSRKENKLAKVTLDLTGFDAEHIWRIDLEKAPNGLNTRDKTPETALLFLQKDKIYQKKSILKILFIELKSALEDSKFVSNKHKPSTLEQCKEKYEAAMSRIYMLLSTNNYENPPNPFQKLKEFTIEVAFYGIIFYLQNNTKNPNSSDKELFDILNKSSNSLLTCQSILTHKDKIIAKFRLCKTEDSDIFLLKDLI